MYLPPSKTFLQKKIKGFSTNKIAHSQALMNTYFDHEFYYQNYEDLHGTIDKDNVNALWNHYVNSGWEEGRFPFQVVVDEIFYIENYPDTSNFDGSMNEHFTRHGYKEGRLPYLIELDLDSYCKRMSIILPDEAHPKDKQEMYKHFKFIGYHSLLF